MLSNLANQSVVQCSIKCTPDSWMNCAHCFPLVHLSSKQIHQVWPISLLGEQQYFTREPLTRLKNRSMQPKRFTKDSNILQPSSIAQSSSPAWSVSKINVSEFWQGQEVIRLCHLKCKILFAFKGLPPGEAPVFPVSTSLTQHSWRGRALCPELSRLQPFKPEGVKAQGCKAPWDITVQTPRWDRLQDIQTVPDGCFSDLVLKKKI